MTHFGFFSVGRLDEEFPHEKDYTHGEHDASDHDCDPRGEY